MDNATLFYICGGVLAGSAVIVSFLGLRFEKFPGRFAPLVFLWFAVFVVGAGTFSVLHAKDHEKHEEPALHQATEEAEEEESH